MSHLRHSTRLLLVAVPIALGVLPDPASAQQRPKVPESLVTTMRQTGTSRVIVQIASPSQGGQQEAFRVPERHVEQLLGTSVPGAVRALGASPYVVTNVTADGLARLERDQSVRRIFPDMEMKAYLAESTELIDVPPLWQSGAKASGVGIAIVDSGIRRDHPFLKDRVVAEACFSSNSPSVNATSLCPNGEEEQTGAGSARDCGPRDDPKGCGHGTHVAGIAAGANGRQQGPGTNANNAKTFNGVAPGASIVAVKVFSRIDGARCGAGNAFCMSAFSSDTLKGLLHIEQIADTHKIAVVNMSLGGGRFEAACDAESPLAEVINRLTAKNIAVIIAAGNEKYVGSIAHPACVSSAIAVGATTKAGQVDTRYSNVSAQIKLLAPGTDIVSSMGQGYSKSSGTSMAAPHIAGLFALLRAQSPDATAATILEQLQKTGKMVKDERVGQNFPQNFPLPNAKAASAALAPARPQPQPAQPTPPQQPQPPKGPDCGNVCMEVGDDKRRFIFALANPRQAIDPAVLESLRTLFGQNARVQALGDGKLLVEVPAGANQRDIDDARRRLGGDGVRVMPDRPLEPLQPGGRYLIR